jgi:tetratricopeptide (TPR) repeat protein
VAPADVHVLLTQVRRWRPPGAGAWKALFAAELEELLGEDPLQPQGLAWRDSVQGKGWPKAALREAAAARPWDWRAWALLGDALHDEPDETEREGAYRKAQALEPDRAGTNTVLAWLLATSGRSGEALPLARRAVELAPWKATGLDTLAYVEADLGHCERALPLARRAVAVAAADSQQLDEYRKRLAELEASCGAGAAAGASSATGAR